MSIQEGLKVFFEQAADTPLLEWIAIIAGVTEVILARANKVLLYPAGIVSTLIYTYLFLRPSTKLYADAILNVYYFVMSIYGWVHWTQKVKGAELTISSSGKKDWLYIIAFSAGGWALLYYMLTILFPMLLPWYRVSDMASCDAFISATAWVGMWLLTRKKIENWILLNISNLAAIPLYIYKGMPFTAALTLFLFIVAIFGYREWQRLQQLQNAAVST